LWIVQLGGNARVKEFFPDPHPICNIINTSSNMFAHSPHYTTSSWGEWMHKKISPLFKWCCVLPQKRENIDLDVGVPYLYFRKTLINCDVRPNPTQPYPFSCLMAFTQCYQTPLDISEERVNFVPCRDNHSAAFITDKCSR
jgi:hypothetical protein